MPEYETRTRQVPIEREIVGHFSNDSGDGIDSDTELGVTLEDQATQHAASEDDQAANTVPAAESRDASVPAKGESQSIVTKG